jgi:hypothetical protein
MLSDEPTSALGEPAGHPLVQVIVQHLAGGACLFGASVHHFLSQTQSVSMRR